MPKYKLSKRSEENLSGCNHKIKDVVNYILDHMDVAVTAGHRSKFMQNALFDKGLSKVQYPNSKHNDYPANAVDLMVYHSDIGYITDKSTVKCRDYYAFLAGMIAGYCVSKGYKFRWGGDWDGDGSYNDQNFDDLMHFEIS